MNKLILDYDFNLLNEMHDYIGITNSIKKIGKSSMASLII